MVFEDSPPMVFDRTGRFLHTIGKMGRGPGEFVSPAAVLALPGDSVLIIDPEASRASIVGPTFQIGRTLNLPSAQIWDAELFNWPGNVVISGLVQTPDQIGWPLHLLTMEAETALATKAFGGNGGVLRRGEGPSLRQQISIPRSGAVWMVDLLRYRLTQWNDRGVLTRSLERRPEWFATPTQWYNIGTPTEPPPPKIAAIGEDAQGRVWIYAMTPRPGWKQAWGDLKIPTSGRGDIPISSLPSVETLYRTTIEVIDPKTEQLATAPITSDYLIIATLHGDIAVAYGTNSEGVPQLSILKVSIHVR